MSDTPTPADESRSSSGAPPEVNQEEMAMLVQGLLEQMQTRFETMSTTILNRIDDMGSRLDTLESTLGDLMTQAGVELPPEKQVEEMKGEKEK